VSAVDAKAKPDWERIGLDYRAGIKTLRQIADEHGITHGAVNKRAQRDGWERDLSAKIAAKANALVSKAAVSVPVSKEAKIAEQRVVDVDRAWGAVRARRDSLLAASDWVALRAMEQGEPVPDEWLAYRQALRDVPQQDDPLEIVWPVAPAS
jgi:hypothetical protein